ncbi:MAG: hypothetical protein ACK5OR_01295 [Betaproteobacteria bacterium]
MAIAPLAAAQENSGWVGEYVLTFESAGKRSPDPRAQPVWGQTPISSQTQWNIREEIRGTLRYTRWAPGAALAPAPEAGNRQRWIAWHMDDEMPGTLTSLVEEEHDEQWRVVEVEGEAAHLRNAANQGKFERIQYLRAQFAQDEHALPITASGSKPLFDAQHGRLWFQMPAIDAAAVGRGVCREAVSLDRPVPPGHWQREVAVGDDHQCRRPFTITRAPTGLGRSAVDVVEVPLPRGTDAVRFQREVVVATTPVARAVLKVRLTRAPALVAAKQSVEATQPATVTVHPVSSGFVPATLRGVQ